MAYPARVEPAAVKQGFEGEPASLMGVGNQAWPGNAGALMGTGSLILRPVDAKGAFPPTRSD
jgi:hypothetical protein